MYLDVSVKAPPIIPSCLKVPNHEEQLSAKEWLKRNGLKVNLWDKIFIFTFVRKSKIDITHQMKKYER